jgi:hypothetical protein
MDFPSYLFLSVFIRVNPWFQTGSFVADNELSGWLLLGELFPSVYSLARLVWI